MSIQDMNKMSMEEIKTKVNEQLTHCSGSLSTWLEYYLSRKQDETNDQLEKINRQMLIYTKVTVVLTIIVTITTIISLFK